jgi:hypothetical protein
VFSASTLAACNLQQLRNHQIFWTQCKVVGIIPVKASFLTELLFQVAALADLGRPEDAFPILRSVLDVDVPSQKKQTFSEDVVNKPPHI